MMNTIGHCSGIFCDHGAIYSINVQTYLLNYTYPTAYCSTLKDIQHVMKHIKVKKL